MSFTKLDFPSAWLTPNTKVMAWGISADGSRISGTYLDLSTDTSKWFTSLRSKQAPFTYSPLSLGGLASDVTCRGTTNTGDLVGWHQTASGATNPFLYLASLPSLLDLPEGLNGSAYGVSENYISGSIHIVGSGAPVDGRLKGTLWRYDSTSQALSFEYPVDVPNPDPAEDVTIYAINSNGDLVVTAMNAASQKKRHFVALRYISLIQYYWVPVLEDPSSFPVSPDDLTILGINKHRVITGWFNSSPNKKSGFYASVSPAGTIQNFQQIDHPSASTATVLAGVSDTGLIVGTYDSRHPFYYIPPEPWWRLVYFNFIPQQISPEKILPKIER
jgi:uncharacterized membrane protein